MNTFLSQLINNCPELNQIENIMLKALAILKNSVISDKKILICGNGGSAADAEHIVGELMKGFLLKRELLNSEKNKIADYYPDEAEYLAKNLQRAIPAISLVNSMSLSTAFSNDVNPDFIFAQQLFGLGNEGDVLIAISTSGNSKNVVLSAKIARIKKISVIALTGEHGGELINFADISLMVPSSDVRYIQEYHIKVYHCLCAMLENDLFGDGKSNNDG